MTELIAKSDRRELRRFALMMTWALPLFFTILLPWLFSYSWQWWPLLVSLFFAALYAFAPGLIFYPYRAWMGVAGVIGWINTRLILGFTFVVLIVPLGLLLRLLGKLQYKDRGRSSDSYYIVTEAAPAKQRLEQPF